MSPLVPLKHLAAINAKSLPETTAEDFEFRYVDIGSVGRGELAATPEKMRFETAPSRARRKVRAGDTLVSTVRTYLRAVLPIREDADDLIASTGFAVITPHGIDSRFFGWWAQSDVFIDDVVARSVGVSYPAINALELGDLPVRVPPLAEQRAIADYLDVETARIDALIAKKQQLIHLLEERRLDKTETVITGLTFGEKVSRTGYFSRVPAKWGETLLRHLLVSVQTGPFGSQLHAEEYVDGNGWPVVNPANIRDGRITPIDSMMISDVKRTELGRHILREGDIVFGRRGEMGRAGLVTATEAGWLCGTGSLRLRLADERLQADYLERLLRTQALKQYFLLNSVGSTMDNLNSEIVLDMPCLLPPIEAQSELVRQANLIDRQTRSAFGSLAQQIALLAERRQALVTACVTGEFDVPGAA